jgi:CheY-like chemotaxis protein
VNHTKHTTRRFRRAHLASNAVLVLESGRTIGPFRVENLSAGGALLTGQIVQLVGLLAVGSTVSVRLLLPGASKSIEISADVVRAVEGTMRATEQLSFAVRFRDVSANTEDLIQSAVLGAIEESRVHGESAVLVLAESVEDGRVLKQSLEGLGQKPFPADTFLEVLRRLQDQNLRIEVALVDLLVRGASGLDILTALADYFPDVRRVLMSRNADAPALRLAQSSGRAHAILITPAEPAELAIAIGLSEG